MDTSERTKLEAHRAECGFIPKTLTVKCGSWIKNAQRTGDDDARVGSCWKDYWQIFTLQDFPTKCPFCGENLEKGDVDGCHIKVDKKREGLESREWMEETYIVPGHHGCNIDYDKVCQANINISIVEAIKKD